MRPINLLWFAKLTGRASDGHEDIIEMQAWRLIL